MPVPGGYVILPNSERRFGAEDICVSASSQSIAGTDAVIEQVMDVKTGSVNNLLTPNHNLKITGYEIKIAGDSAVNGIYFVNQATFERTWVEDSDIVTNNPSELIVVIPALAAGAYRLEVTTQYIAGSLLKEPHTVTLGKTLTIVGGDVNCPKCPYGEVRDAMHRVSTVHNSIPHKV
jgi:hypothetical protein